MSRVHRFRPAELDPAQKALYADLTSGSRATGPPGVQVAEPDGRLTGPFNAMLLNPVIGDALQKLGATIRYHGALSARSREIAILTVAARLGSAFEWRSHEPVAVGAGLTDRELRALRDLADPELTDADPELTDPEEAAVTRGAALLLGDGPVSDEDYRRLADALGQAKLFELSTLVGYYRLLARQMVLFDVR
nr:carboxymuconolactone decarboxylase family protein [Micromonospora sp. DSM 115978]